MSKFLATITPVGANLFLVEQVSRPTDPGYGVTPPVDPGYGRPEWGDRPDNSLPWGPGRPDHSLPGHGHPDNSLPVPPPAGVVTPPIVLPERPHLPTGSGVVVPLPDTVVNPTGEAPPPGTKPFVLWYGPGSQSSVVYLKPSTPAAAPK